MKDGPLDMRMDNSSGISAEDVVNTYSFERSKAIRKFTEKKNLRSPLLLP